MPDGGPPGESTLVEKKARPNNLETRTLLEQWAKTQNLDHRAQRLINAGMNALGFPSFDFNKPISEQIQTRVVNSPQIEAVDQEIKEPESRQLFENFAERSDIDIQDKLGILTRWAADLYKNLDGSDAGVIKEKTVAGISRITGTQTTIPSEGNLKATLQKAINSFKLPTEPTG